MKRLMLNIAFAKIIILASCNNDKIPQLNLDPIRMSFEGKGIISMQEKLCTDSTCHVMDSIYTLYLFDRTGNVIETRKIGAISKYSYYENGLLKREFNQGDVVTNWFYSYDWGRGKKTVLKYRSPINHLKWESPPEDVDLTRTDTIVYTLTDDGNVSQVVDNSRNTVVKYAYNTGKIIEKNTFMRNVLIERSRFSYSEGHLSSVTSEGNEPYKKMYQLSPTGLLVSAVEIKEPYKFYMRYFYEY